MRPAEIAHVVSDSGATLRDPSRRRRCAGAAPLVRAVAAEPGDVGALFYTSGTTGKPKGAELTHAGLLERRRPPRPCSRRAPPATSW